MIRELLGPCVFVAVMLVAAPAQAAVELWNQLETDVLLLQDNPFAPRSMGFVTDVRFSSRLTGLERVQLRWGPRWDLWGPLSLGVNHTAYLQQPDPGVFIQEQRAELEPVVKGSLGPVEWRNRGRLELRLRPDSARWRFRDQLRVEGAIAAGWLPFASDEAFFDLNGAGFNENRVTVGLAREVAGAGWELAYTLRTRHGAGADPTPDHLVTLAWFNALRRPPLLTQGPLQAAR